MLQLFQDLQDVLVVIEVLQMTQDLLVVIVVLQLSWLRQMGTITRCYSCFKMNWL